jgi:rhamnosyl/mannosyltransferase
VSPGFPWALQAAIRDFAPDVLHLHVPNTSAFAALAVPAARRLPWVLHWHADVDPAALDRRLRWAYPFYKPFETALLRRAARVVATSMAYRDASMALRPWHARCEVIPLGVDLERLPDPPAEAVSRARAHWPPAESDSRAGLRILAVGRLAYYKGFEVLVEAMQHLPEDRLLIVGDGPSRSALEQRVDALGLRQRVRLAGAISAGHGASALAPYFAASHLLCLPSLDRSEAFGLVLLEARRYGCVTVASDIPGSGVAWVVQGTGGGHLARPGDPQSLAQSIHQARLAARIGAPGDTLRPMPELPDWFDVDLGARRLLGIYDRAVRDGAP